MSLLNSSVVRLLARTSPGVSDVAEGRLYFDSTRNLFLVSEDAGAYRAAFPEASSQASDTTITTTSATDILATGMELTPDAGTYLVIFSSTLSCSGNNNSVFASIYVDGTQVIGSERGIIALPSNDGASFCCCAVVTVSGGQTIEGRWRRTAGTASMYERSLVLVRVG